MVSPVMGAATIGTMYFLWANCAQHGGSASGGGLIGASLLQGSSQTKRSEPRRKGLGWSNQIFDIYYNFFVVADLIFCFGNQKFNCHKNCRCLNQKIWLSMFQQSTLRSSKQALSSMKHSPTQSVNLTQRSHLMPLISGSYALKIFF